MSSHSPSGRHEVRTRHIGLIDQPVLVCGGAYSNLEALAALFDAAEKLGIPPDHIIHTGDVVAYCGSPQETAALLQASKAHAILGNVEESLAQNASDCGCGFDEGSACDLLAVEWYAHADKQIQTATRAWMESMPHHLTFEIAGLKARVVHGGVSAVNRYLFASHPDTDFETELALAPEADLIIAGHSGLPFTRKVGGRTWHNSGALGLPANDGTARVWFSVLTPGEHGLSIRHHPLVYDHEAAQAKMKALGLCEAYAQTLLTGLWPSLDVLPEAERAATGIPLVFDQPFIVEKITAAAADA